MINKDFELLESRDLPDYNGTGYLFRHKESGLEVFQIVNSDPECFFAFGFPTPSENDCGTAHIIEHSVLAGSERFPQRDPFNVLDRGSANSYLNAMTFPDRTVYPGATVIKKDFDNIFEVYADAVFRPLLRKETFLQEGIRCVMKDGKCTKFDGVVFNEMQGDAFDSGAVTADETRRILFDGTNLAFDSGGAPLSIPTLTYESYLDFYRRHYSPSCCRLLIYGDLPVGAKLDFLAENYLLTNTYNIITGPERSTPQLRPRAHHGERYVRHSALEEGGETLSSVTVSWLTDIRSTDRLGYFAMNVLVDILLGNPAAPLYSAIVESGLGNDLNSQSGTETVFPYMPFTAGFDGADPDDADKIEAFILSTLKRFAEEGLDKEVVDTAIRRQLFRLREIPGGMPNGLRALFRCANTWFYGGSPLDAVSLSEPIKLLQDALRDNPRFFEDFIEKNLIENTNRILLIVTPSADLIPSVHKKLKDMLPAASPAIEEENRLFNAFAENMSPDERGDIGFLTREDFKVSFTPEDTELLDSEVTHNRLFTNGIVYFNASADLSDFTEDELKLVSLYSRLLQMTGTESESYIEISRRLRRFMPSFFVSQDVLRPVGSSVGHPVMNIFFKCAEEDLEASLDVLGDLFLGADVKNSERIAAAVEDLETSFRENVADSGNAYASMAAASTLSQSLYTEELITGITAWFAIDDLKKSGDPAAAAIKTLLSMKEKLSARSRMCLHFTASESASQTISRAAAKFLSRFDSRIKPELSGLNLLRPKSTSPILYALPGTVGFTAMVLPAAGYTDAESPAEALFLNMVSSGFLWEQVRCNGGAYGVSASLNSSEHIAVFSSYRDPRIRRTFRDFTAALSTTPKEADLESSVISVLASEIKPRGPQERSFISFHRQGLGLTNSLRLARRDAFISLSLDEVLACRSLLTPQTPSLAVLASASRLSKSYPDVPFKVLP